MKRGFKAVLVGALVAALLVPAAGAKPGNGNGHGPPAWAGGGNGDGPATEGGKPEWAGKQHGQAKKAERQAARGGAAEDEDTPKHQNPAWVCKFEREQMGAEAFAEEYGENENKANAFGKCVSREAHDRDGVTQAPAEEPTGPADSDGDEPEEPALPANVQAFLHYLWPLLF